MTPAANGLFHVDPTHARHHEAAKYLWELVLDLDFLRIGKTPMRPVDYARLAEWPAHAADVRGCHDARFLKGGHAEELAFGDALVETVRADLDAGRTPQMPDAGVTHYLAATARLERCREDSVRRLARTH